jgi:uncharacterized protein
MRTRPTRFLSILSGLLLTSALAFGCAMPQPGPAPDSGDAGSGRPVPAPPAPPAPQSTQQRPTLDDANAAAMDAVEVVNMFWAEYWNLYFTGTYRSPEIVGPYSESTVPTCGGRPLRMNNAYFCSEGFIAWDAAFMSEGYQSADVFPAVVLAHEAAHAVQAQIDAALVAEARELQADCLAGATLAGAAHEGWLIFDAGDDIGIATILDMLGDDTDWQQSGDHGSGPQRIEAFVTGVDYGVEGCLPAVK